MTQVPADNVITELVNEIAQLHREKAILKVQVDLLQQAAAQTAVLPPVPATPVTAAETPAAT